MSKFNYDGGYAYLDKDKQRQLGLDILNNGHIDLVGDINAMENKFQVGDIVEAFGLTGIVCFVGTDERLYVRLSDNYGQTFLLDGKLEFWHKEPSLKLIERPKKKVKRWVNLYSYNLSGWEVTGRGYDSLEGANFAAADSRIACVEIEVEED